MKALKLCALTAAVGMLSACGGGDSNSSGSPKIFEAPTAISLTGSSAPEETISQQSARAAAIFSRTDSFTAATIYGETDLPDLQTFNLASDCSGTICIFTHPETGLSYSITLADLREIEARTDTGRAVLTKNGITLLEGRGGTAGRNYRVYGAWMDHGVFSVETKAQTTVELADGTDVNFTVRGASAGGDLSGSRPSVSATWRGVMVGTPSRGDHRDNILQGDARLTYDSQNQDLDAVFNNIKDLDRKADYTVTVVRFNDVPVAADGSYSAGRVGNLIQGGFGGPSHEETAGVFEQQGIVGAFGAKR